MVVVVVVMVLLLLGLLRRKGVRQRGVQCLQPGMRRANLAVAGEDERVQGDARRQQSRDFPHADVRQAVVGEIEGAQGRRRTRPCEGVAQVRAAAVADTVLGHRQLPEARRAVVCDRCSDGGGGVVSQPVVVEQQPAQRGVVPEGFGEATASLGAYGVHGEDQLRDRAVRSSEAGNQLADALVVDVVI